MRLCEGDFHFVPIAGDITETNLADFRIALDRATNNSESDVHLDLSQTENLTAPALGLIVQAKKHLAGEGRAMHIRLGNNEDLLHPVSHILVG